jgi:uncharacterized protein involved in outer membrane biogenesis
MRKLVTGVLGALLLAVVVVAAILFVPSPLQKWAVERGATLAIGRQVVLGEPFRLRAWPPVAIEAADIRVANAHWGEAPDLAQIASVDARIDLLAFWRSDRVQIDRLVLTRPRLNLEVGADGQRNWTLAADDAALNATGSEENGAISPFVLGEVRVEDATVSYHDRAGGIRRTAEAIERAITQAGPDQQVAIEGGLTLEGRKATLKGTVDRPQGAVAGERSPIRLALGLPGASATFDGQIETRAPAAAGALAIQVPAPGDLLA